jgi:hypothetical protein
MNLATECVIILFMIIRLTYLSFPKSKIFALPAGPGEISLMCINVSIMENIKSFKKDNSENVTL